jgi:hypothetical protein
MAIDNITKQIRDRNPTAKIRGFVGMSIFCYSSYVRSHSALF